jgi:acyl-CoA hydrolase
MERFLPRYGGEVLFAGDGAAALVAEQGVKERTLTAAAASICYPPRV